MPTHGAPRTAQRSTLGRRTSKRRSEATIEPLNSLIATPFMNNREVSEATK